MHIGFNHRAVLVGTVVVGGDAAGAKIDALTDRRVTQIGQMIGLGAARQTGILDFHKIADMHFRAKPGARTQPRIRPDQ